ncbi:hypothetical protein JN11_04688 [Mucilaginibacter frigoritolerans]|uniref:Uncharacterized protein n=1 Tax=Mucilaginibacter frigoritolerans TaxID=652788 RepID=A0A562TMV9_9SPHI|nr:hypothetical protein JN11_04688 [Mucilaginibacter frigoritolerans]
MERKQMIEIFDAIFSHVQLAVAKSKTLKESFATPVPSNC